MAELSFSVFVGIDVSYEKLDVAWRKDADWTMCQITNSWADAQLFAADLSKILPDCCCIIEHTGTYSSKISLALYQAGLKVSLITPAQSKAFAAMKHRTTKNDRSDARLLAEYGLFNTSELRFYAPPPEHQIQFRQLLEAVDQLEKMRQQVRNQQHAYQQLPPLHQQQILLNAYQNTVNQLDKQIEELQINIKQLHGHDEDLDQTRKLMTTIKGIGEKTANIILAKTQGIKRFDNPKQLAKFAGIAPTENSSGSSVRGRRGINRSGNAILRKALYCATWSALRGNKACKTLFDRLRSKGKPVKVALIAVANLLLRQIFAVVTTQKPFDNEFYLKNCAPL
ncbi:MAG: IS110 family transposase [Saprospiraceae bacterium]|nr:IS110 family transposase [Saprospiraceae bacterium]